MALIAQAENAQDAAAALHKFLEYAPDDISEITALISGLYALISALRRLNTVIDINHAGVYGRISAEIKITLESIDYTFKDFNRLLGHLGRYNHLSRGTAYRQTWEDIDEFFHAQSNCLLRKRLQYYTRYLLQMECVIEQGWSDFEEEYLDLGERIEALLDKQNDEGDYGIGNLSVGQTAAQRQRSFERRRPHVAPPQAIPNPQRLVQHIRLNNHNGRRRPRPLSPQSPGYDQDFTHFPTAPEVPLSPTTTNTTTTHSSRSTSSSLHWVPRLFEQSQSTTAFRKSGQSSACFDVDMPGASSRLADEYDKLLELPFEGGDLVVRLYQRPHDERARIHCRTLRPSRARKQSSIYLTSLEIKRKASTLEFCTVDRSSRLWARLRFPSYERLVLFFCTFLALRADDGGAGNHIPDYKITGEDQYFQGEILDDSFPHALTVYRDHDTGAVRLQASVLEGELKRKPVWTAFITHQITSRSWVAKPGPKVIHLADLQRFIFVDEYTPQLGPEGQHELTFKTRDDTKDFLRAIDTLRAM